MRFAPARRWLLPWLLCSGVGLAQAAGNCPETLRVGTLDYVLAPYLTETVDGGTEDPPGLLLPWLREALQFSGCGATRLQIQRMSVLRGYEAVRGGELDLWAPTTVSEQSLVSGVFPMQGDRIQDPLGMARARYSFYVQKGNPQDLRWDGKTLVGPSRLVLGISNASVLTQWTRERGLATESAPSINQTINKLLAGRLPVILVPDLSVQVRGEAERARLERLEPEALVVWFHGMFNREFARKQAHFVSQYWLGLCVASHKTQPELPRCPPAP